MKLRANLVLRIIETLLTIRTLLSHVIMQVTFVA